ncbi:MAG TPA: energy transducer TonB, partial [Trichocoleus sp.]
MGLSQFCAQQQDREQLLLRRVLLWGVAGSIGVHAIALALGQLDIWRRPVQNAIAPIEVIVSEPSLEEPIEQVEPPVPIEPAELSTETNSGGAITAAPAAQLAAAPPAPSIPETEPVPEAETPEAETPEAEPEDELDTQAESDLEEPQETLQSEEETPEETEEPEPEPEEEPAMAAAPDTESQAERLRDFLQRLREAQTAEADSSQPGGVPGGSPAGEPGGVVGGSPEGQPEGQSGGVAAAGPSSSGEGTSSGRGQGSRTVACQDCARPEYPESALAQGAEGQPQVQVSINPDGSVRSVTLTRSSGNPAIDQAAIAAARRSRFQPVEGGASVPIEYDLTIEGSRRNREARQRGERRTVEVPTSETETTESAPTSPAAATAPNASEEATLAAPATGTPASEDTAAPSSAPSPVSGPAPTADSES